MIWIVDCQEGVTVSACLNSNTIVIHSSDSFKNFFSALILFEDDMLLDCPGHRVQNPEVEPNH